MIKYFPASHAHTFSSHFQWANNHSEPVPYLCTFCQLKCQLALFGHFQMLRQMSALVGNMAGNCLCVYVCVYARNHHFSMTQRSVFSEMKPGSPALMRSLSFESKEIPNVRHQACVTTEEICWDFIFTFSFGLPAWIFLSILPSPRKILLSALCVTWLYCII